MNKELTPLEAIDRVKNHLEVLYMSCDNDGSESGSVYYELDIIETALKEKENIEKTINELFSENGKVITTIDIKKKLKALEIIKKKRVDVNCFLIYDLKRYNDFIAKNEFMKLTQEQYDLLKEVLL